MKSKLSILMGILISLLASGKALAQDLRAYLLNQKQLAQVREAQPDFLSGIDLHPNQKLMLKENSSHQIINIQIFEDTELSGNYVDGTGSEI